MFAWLKELTSGKSRVPQLTPHERIAACRPPAPPQKAGDRRRDSADTIYIRGINAQGETCITCSMGTFNASAEIQVMTGALELARAVKRGVKIEPEKFYELTVGQFLKSVENAWDGKD